MKQALKVHKGKIDLVAGSGSGKGISTNDPDHLSTTKTKSIAQPSSAERNNKNSKENSSSRTCRCAGGTSNKISGRSSAAKSTTSTATNTNTVELLQNPKTLPIREFEKLSPVVSTTIANSARSSLSSVSSSIVDTIHGEKTITRNTTTATTSTTTASNSETIAVRNTNNQIDKLLKNETAANANTVETIYLNILNKKNLKKLLQANGNGTSLTASKSSSSEKESCSSSGGSSTKRLATDDTLILRICDLESSTRYSSGSPVSTATQNGRTSSDCIKVKTKVRTKTDPHPVSSSQKQRRFSSTTTSSIDLKNYQKCSSQSAAGQHNGSKCNCSSCNVSKTSTLSSENKTKSVGTQHNASAQCAFDPWVKQSTIAADSKRGTKSRDTNSNARTENSLLNQKLAHTNAKVIVITDDFKKKALNQEVLVDTKRKILRYMKANKLLSSSRSMDDVRIAASASTGNGCNQVNVTLNMNEHQMNTSVLSINKSNVGVSNNDDRTNGSTNTADVKKLKAISKSVDNISVLSAELDALDNVGSVELIFISDEFLNKVSDQDVIVLKNNPKIPAALVARKLASGKSANGNYDADANAKHFGRKQIIVITDEFCRESMKNKKIVIVDAHNKVTKHQQLNRQSSAESSVDDVNNKITSRAFQSYDEEAEHLESKKIQ